MADIANKKTDKGFGNWVQADSSLPTYLKIVIPGSAKVKVVTSETDGPGAGGRSVTEEIVEKTSSVTLPAGGYHINIQVLKNPDSIPVTAVTTP